jgi:hypothetical protein
VYIEVIEGELFMKRMKPVFYIFLLIAEADKRKSFCRIALVMAFPTVAFIIMVIAFVIGLSMVI